MAKRVVRPKSSEDEERKRRFEFMFASHLTTATDKAGGRMSKKDLIDAAKSFAKSLQTSSINRLALVFRDMWTRVPHLPTSNDIALLAVSQCIVAGEVFFNHAGGRWRGELTKRCYQLPVEEADGMCATGACVNCSLTRLGTERIIVVKEYKIVTPTDGCVLLSPTAMDLAVDESKIFTRHQPKDGATYEWHHVVAGVLEPLLPQVFRRAREFFPKDVPLVQNAYFSEDGQRLDIEIFHELPNLTRHQFVVQFEPGYPEMVRKAAHYAPLLAPSPPVSRKRKSPSK